MEERLRSFVEPFVGIQRWLDTAARWLCTPKWPGCSSSEGSDAPVIVGMILGLAYFYLVPLPLLAMPGLVWFGLLAWKRLDAALALMPLTFPFWYVPKRLFDDKVFPLSEITLAICVVLAITQFALLPGRPPRTNSWLSWIRAGIGTAGWWRRHLGVALTVGIALLVLGVSLGVLVARRPPDALRAWRWEIAEPLIYFALLLYYGRSMRTIALSVWSFLGGALLVAALAVVQVLWLHVTFVPIAQGNRLVHYAASTGAFPRATAIIYGSANSLGTWLARALPLALALACAASSNRLVRMVAWLLTVAYLPALFWSNSRGAWVAAMIASLLVVCVVYRRARIVVLALIPALLVVAIWQRSAIAEALLTGHGGSLEVRLLLWLASWHMIRDHLLLGIGPDQFLYYYSPHYTSHPYWIPRQNGHITPAIYQPNLSQPHNLILDLWLSGGLLALSGFALLLVGMAEHVWQLWRTLPVWQMSRPPSGEGSGREEGRWEMTALPAGPLSLGIVAMVLAGLIHGMVDSAYFSPDLALAFWWSMAVVLLLHLRIEPVKDSSL